MQEKAQLLEKHNNLIFGFSSVHDYFTSIFGFKNIIVNFVFVFCASLTTFISDYVWDSASAVYFMLFLIGIDAITGVIKAFKQKTFSSARLPRIAVIMVSYCVLLSIAWNAAVYSMWFKFLPSVVYGMLIGTLILSVFENFAIIGIIDRKLFNTVKDNLTSIVELIKNITAHTGKGKSTSTKKK